MQHVVIIYTLHTIQFSLTYCPTKTLFKKTTFQHEHSPLSGSITAMHGCTHTNHTKRWTNRSHLESILTSYAKRRVRNTISQSSFFYKHETIIKIFLWLVFPVGKNINMQSVWQKHQHAMCLCCTTWDTFLFAFGIICTDIRKRTTTDRKINGMICVVWSIENTEALSEEPKWHQKFSPPAKNYHV